MDVLAALGITIDPRGVQKGARLVNNALDSIRERAKKATSELHEGFGSVKDAVFSLKGAIAALGVGVLAKSFVDAASTTEQYRVRLSALLGSVQKGSELFDDMAKYASKVPFEYEEIMGAATQLAGVLKGGTKEINEWMPMIGDLAAVSGLSIQEATDQIARMYSAGAASADLFRERGILSMLGFQSGVTYSAEETRKQLMYQWKRQGSQFRGATEELSKTWSGTMSMLSDKWFAFRSALMEAGVFDYLKAIVQTFDEYLGGALDGSNDKIKDWANTTVQAMRGAAKGLGVVLDGWRWMRISIAGVQRVVAGIKGVFALAFGGINEIIRGFQYDFNLFIAEPIKEMGRVLNKDWDFTVSVDQASDFDKILSESAAEIEETNREVGELLSEEMPSLGLERAMGRVEAKFEKLRAAAEAAKEEVGGGGTMPQTPSGGGPLDTKGDDKVQKDYEALRGSLRTETEVIMEEYAERQELLASVKGKEYADEAERKSLLEELELRHQAKLGDLSAQGELERRKFSEKNARDKTKFLLGEMVTLTEGLAQHNRVAFEANKAFSVANAIISTYEGVAKAWSLGPILGPPMAALVAAAGFAQVQAITSTSFQGGGGGTTPSAAGSAPVVNNQPVQGSQEQQTPQQTQKVYVDFGGNEDRQMSVREWRKFMRDLQEEAGDVQLEF